ncbi:hypothetical protein CKM354_000135500 [Cercospora kikuchii]|uniref:Uncharacterized protein n=1 Tax=Cercospora kikuchii TaxID=84275 RepID=A0A9P3CAJ2_9PEZI|nr:uncharacterized protein CKM354_000135500 [Cercospora kikuchii]GIZ37926.1 hypothetical protein CKM354_000135500 [Cercospora kikuchii]
MAKTNTTFTSLPEDILVMLPHYLCNIEDYTNLSSTCRKLRSCMATALPNTILRLAAAQSTTFFRPSPHFLVMATARELGNWARQSDENEASFASHCQLQGIDGMLELALTHCGLTVQRIRELYEMNMSIIKPVTDIIDKCVGDQWYSNPRFWDGGVSDAYTISSDPDTNFFHLAIYGELFAPEFDYVLTAASGRRLGVDTRLAFVRYCIPEPCAAPEEVASTGPYARDEKGNFLDFPNQNNLAITWTIRSSRWRPHWKHFRTEVAGCEDFKDNFDDGWWYVPDLGADEEGGVDAHWRQRLYENIMICQGLEGMGMIRPGLQSAWVEQCKEWRKQIAELKEEPAMVHYGRQATQEYPFLLGDLRICMKGYVPGTE